MKRKKEKYEDLMDKYYAELEKQRSLTKGEQWLRKGGMICKVSGIHIEPWQRIIYARKKIDNSIKFEDYLSDQKNKGKTEQEIRELYLKDKYKRCRDKYLGWATIRETKKWYELRKQVFKKDLIYHIILILLPIGNMVFWHLCDFANIFTIGFNTIWFSIMILLLIENYQTTNQYQIYPTKEEEEEILRRIKYGELHTW